MKIQIDLRSFLLGITAAISLLFLFGNKNATNDHLKCESISIVDASGRTIAVLGSTDLGTGMLELHDAAGNASVVARDGALATFNPSGIRTCYMGTTADGDGILKTYEREGKTTAYMGTISETGKGSRGSLKLYHANEKLAARINDGFMQTFTTNEIVTCYAGTSDDGSGILKTFGTTGNKVGYLGTSAEGNGILHLYDSEGKLRYMR